MFHTLDPSGKQQIAEGSSAPPAIYIYPVKNLGTPVS